MDELQNNVREKRKAIAFVILLISCVCAGFSIYIVLRGQRAINKEIAIHEHDIRSLARIIEKGATRKYRSRIKSFLNIKAAPVRKEIIKAFAQQDRPEVLRLSTPYYELFNKEDRYFSSFAWFLPGNHVFLRLHKPEMFGDDVSLIRSDIVRANLDHQQNSGYLTGYSGLEYRVVQPVVFQGQHLGVMQFGLKDNFLVDRITKELRIPVVQVMPNDKFQIVKFSKLPNYSSGPYTVQSSDLDLIKSATTEIDWSFARQPVVLQGKDHIICKVIELPNFAGEPEGWIFALLDVSEHAAEMRADIIKVVSVSIVLVLLASFLISRSYGRLIQKISDLNQSLAQNNLELEDRVMKRTLELQNEQEKLFVTLRSIGDSVITTDLDGKIVLINKIAEQLTGWSHYEAIGRPAQEVFNIINEDTGRPCENPVDKVLASGKIVCLANHTALIAKDGRRYLIEDSGAPIFDKKSKIIGVVLVFRDVTERKQAREEKAKLKEQLQQSQKMEAIGTLSGGVAHDFNNILSIILGYTVMAKEDAPPGSAYARDLDQVLQAGNRAKDLVQQILTFSRQAQVEKKSLKPQPIIKEALKMLRASIPTTIEIQENISPDCGNIHADPTQLHQIVMNLCTNAFHAMEAKGGVLRVGLKVADSVPLELKEGKPVAGEVFIELSCSDTGQGIGPDMIEKIFEPFFTTKEQGKGTGMGLAITYGIVKEYGGTITVDSQLGKGAAFHIYLPQIKQEAAPAPSEDAIVPEGSERILFVDDEEPVANMGKDMLERLGYHVTAKQSCPEALETFRNQFDKFDLVITDQTMPGMTGLDLARRMLEIRPDIPIILCTGYSALVNEDVAKAQGITEFVLKPISQSTIAKLIRKALGEASEVIH